VRDGTGNDRRREASWRQTALAARLRERHGWTVLAKDTIKEALFDTLNAI
jgi:hypothetical protein